VFELEIKKFIKYTQKIFNCFWKKKMKKTEKQ